MIHYMEVLPIVQRCSQSNIKMFDLLAGERLQEESRNVSGSGNFVFFYFCSFCNRYAEFTIHSNEIKQVVNISYKLQGFFLSSNVAGHATTNTRTRLSSAATRL